MQWKTPKNSEKYYWTDHVQGKMHFYGISEQKVLGVIRNPKRIETGIVEDTVAVMQPVGTIKKGPQKPKWGQPAYITNGISIDEESSSSAKASADTWGSEIWVLYKIKSQRSKVFEEEIDIEKPSQKLQELQNKISSKKQLVIISTWRYPGMAPEHDPIPAEIMREIEESVLK